MKISSLDPFMRSFTKSKEMSSFDIIKTSLRCYFNLNHQKFAFIVLLLVLIVVKNVCNGFELIVSKRISNNLDEQYLSLVKILLLHGSRGLLNYFTDILFDRQLIPFGGVIFKTAIRNILFSDSIKLFDVTGGSTEYFITEGAKALAKISRFMILGLFSKCVHLIMDLTLVYREDKSGGIIFFTVLVGTIVFCGFRFFQVTRTLQHLENSFNYAFEREKSYVETIDNISVYKSYGAENEGICKYEAKTRKWEIAWTSYNYLIFMNDFIFDFSTAIFKITVTWMYAREHANESVSELVDILAIVADILKTGSNLVKLHKEISESIQCSHFVMSYLQLAREDIASKAKITEFYDSIALKNVSYSARDKLIFNNIQMNIKKGDKIAISGRNGCGKSSIFKILMNFDEYNGLVELDGIDIEKISMIDYRSIFTFVPQDTKLFDDTIYYNLSLGNDKSFDEIVSECIKIGIHDTIMKFPTGYNTFVGEGGKNINGGLRQMIFYARAFLRDTPIYLFDEPTNNLDEKFSAILLSYILGDHSRKKTFVVICHDLEFVHEFSKIYSFTNNELVLEKKY